MTNNINHITINYIMPIAIGLIIYVFYRYYKLLFITVKENLTNMKICSDNSCGKGCQKPNGITDSCIATIYKDESGKCHIKCPYVCSNKNKTNKTNCKYDECCIGCGYSKFTVPCQLADNNSEKDPMPYQDKDTTNHSNSKSKIFNDNMRDVEQNDLNFKGWSPFVKKWPCDLNVTGTFTECGPPAYNSCGVGINN